MYGCRKKDSFPLYGKLAATIAKFVSVHLNRWAAYVQAQKQNFVLGVKLSINIMCMIFLACG